MNIEQQISELVEIIAGKSSPQRLTISTAESCTGGGIATALTAIAGSSNWFEGSVVSYSNNSKHRLLGVSEQLIENVGAVSGEVAEAMVSGILEITQTKLAVAVTGIAGPSGGSTEKPVGTVWIAWKISGKAAVSQEFLFSGTRHLIRQQTIVEALKGLIQRL